jgi:hypothetical protein
MELIGTGYVSHLIEDMGFMGLTGDFVGFLKCLCPNVCSGPQIGEPEYGLGQGMGEKRVSFTPVSKLAGDPDSPLRNLLGKLLRSK